MSEIRAAEELILGGDVCRIRLTVTPAGPDGGESDAMAMLWGDEAKARQLIKEISGIATRALKDAYWGGEYTSFRTVDYWSTLSIDLTEASRPR